PAAPGRLLSVRMRGRIGRPPQPKETNMNSSHRPIDLFATRPSIAEQNDNFRRRPSPGWVFTAGVTAFGPQLRKQIVQRVVAFADFSAENDPHGEHDFGSFELEGHRVLWKIDYHNPDLSDASEDPSNPSLTRRVLTIMLASEY